MALYLLFKNKNTLLFIYIFCLLFKLQMCQIILTDPVYISQTKEDSIYSVHIHTKQIIQAQSSLQMSMQLWYARTKGHKGELIK